MERQNLSKDRGLINRARAHTQCERLSHNPRLEMYRKEFFRNIIVVRQLLMYVGTLTKHGLLMKAVQETHKARSHRRGLYIYLLI